MSSGPSVSVIVAVRDGARSLPTLLERLDLQTIGRDAMEVVVADNASRDAGGAIARRAGAKLVEEPIPGRARARNRAVASSRGGLLAFTDADCAPRPDWLERLLPGLDDAEMAGGSVLIPTPQAPSAVERFESLWRFPQREAVLERGWSATANMAMRRESFDAVGGFDASIRRIGEDVDLCLRAAAAGQRIAWRPEAIVEHEAEHELWPLLRRAFDHAVSDDLLHRRHGLPPARTWRHPGPLVRGDWALRRFGVDPERVPEPERGRVLRVARLEYAARMAGSIWSAWENRREPRNRFRGPGE